MNASNPSISMCCIVKNVDSIISVKYIIIGSLIFVFGFGVIVM